MRMHVLQADGDRYPHGSDQVVIEELNDRFAVTAGGYMASFRKCIRDECAQGQRSPCVRPYGHIETVDAWLKHCRSHCHDWHYEKVEYLVRQLAAVGVPAKPRKPATYRSLVAPGTSIEWADWAEPLRTPVVRTGVAWSNGPRPNSVWVQPDDDPTNPVALRLPTGKYARRGGRPEVLAGFPPTWQRDTIRRCDNLMRAGQVHGFVDHETQWDTQISWHTDPDCPETFIETVSHHRSAPVYTPVVERVRKKQHVNGAGEPRTVPAYEVIDLLLSQRIGETTLKAACRRCVYLAEPADIEDGQE